MQCSPHACPNIAVSCFSFSRAASSCYTCSLSSAVDLFWPPGGPTLDDPLPAPFVECEDDVLQRPSPPGSRIPVAAGLGETAAASSHPTPPLQQAVSLQRLQVHSKAGKRFLALSCFLWISHFDHTPTRLQMSYLSLSIRRCRVILVYIEYIAKPASKT